MIGRTLALAVILSSVPAAAGAGVGPEIAYSLRAGRDIYLINPDGTGLRVVYQAPAKKSVLSLDIRPGGGEMTFEEVNSSGQTGTLKTITYGASGRGTVTRSITGCRFHSDTAANGDLLFVDSCNGAVKHWASGSSAPVVVGVPGLVSKVAWLPDGSFLYAANARIYRATLAAPAGTSLAAQDCVQTLNAAHGGNEAIIGDACGQAIKRLQVNPPALSANLQDGLSPAFSSDDQCFIYISPPARNGSQLLIRRLDGSGSAVQLGKKANYASVDWRGDSQPSACPVAGATSSAFEFRAPNN